MLIMVCCAFSARAPFENSAYLQVRSQLPLVPIADSGFKGADLPPPFPAISQGGGVGVEGEDMGNLRSGKGGLGED